MRLLSFRWLRTILICLVGIAAVFIVSSFAPALSTASINMLFRLRGELPEPDDVIIVAIDDASIQRLGQYPWPRTIIAEGLEKISEGDPKAVGIDVVYAEKSATDDDRRFAEAIKNSGRVILPTHLYETGAQSVPGGTETTWLRPLPEFDAGLAGKGHAHAAPDVDGTLRSVQLSKSDDKGTRFWAFGLEVLRVAEGIDPNDFDETAENLSFGPYHIRRLPVETVDDVIPLVATVRSNEMLINYIGPVETFRQYSFVDVLNGDVPADNFTGKIVLVGATSPTLGDSQITPFMHYAGNGDRQGGQAMPGVEVQANIINTIRSRLCLAILPDIWFYVIVLLIIVGAAVTINLQDGWRQLALLTAGVMALVAAAIIAFDSFFLILPLPEMLTAFFVSVPLLLLDRNLSASRDLDVKLETLADAQRGFLLDSDKTSIKTKNRRVVPRNLESKLRAVDEITARLLSRMSFINRVLSGMTEGVMVSDTSNRIVFVNQRVLELFGTASADILNRDIVEFLKNREVFDTEIARKSIGKALGGQVIQHEFEEAGTQIRNFLVQLSPVRAVDDSDLNRASAVEDAPAFGVLILFFDITEQRELDRLKAETLQLVSHELRSPLTSIQGLSDVLRKFRVSPAESGEMLETIHSEAVRLNEIINRFLDTRRLESGIQTLQISPVHLEKLLSDSITAAMPLAAEKRIEVLNETFGPLPILMADATLLAQAIGNLLSNAIKYSPADSAVSVEGTDTGSELQISVKDNGYGIPHDALGHIFKKFYRLERDAVSKTVGTGLGLSFVKDVAEKHNGSVTVESRENAGSIFTLHLPL